MTAIVHLAQLRYTLERLQALPSKEYAAANKKLLRELLTATLKSLHDLYPDSLSFDQRYRFVYNLNSLELQFLAITPGNEVPVHLWASVHATLQSTIETALADIGDAHRKPTLPTS